MNFKSIHWLLIYVWITLGDFHCHFKLLCLHCCISSYGFPAQSLSQTSLSWVENSHIMVFGQHFCKDNSSLRFPRRCWVGWKTALSKSSVGTVASDNSSLEFPSSSLPQTMLGRVKNRVLQRQIHLGFPAATFSLLGRVKNGAGPDVSWLQGRGGKGPAGWGGADRRLTKTKCRGRGLPDAFQAVNILFSETLGKVCHTHKCFQLLSTEIRVQGVKCHVTFRWKVAEKPAFEFCHFFGQWS